MIDDDIQAQKSAVFSGVEHAPFATAFQDLLSHVPNKASTSEAAKFYGGAVEVLRCRFVPA